MFKRSIQERLLLRRLTNQLNLLNKFKRSRIIQKRSEILKKMVAKIVKRMEVVTLVLSRVMNVTQSLDCLKYHPMTKILTIWMSTGTFICKTRLSWPR
jgi:hypothetical protein